MSIKVMLADDHVMLREGIKQLLEFDGSIEIVSEASDGDECLEKLKICKPQIGRASCRERVFGLV